MIITLNLFYVDFSPEVNKCRQVQILAEVKLFCRPTMQPKFSVPYWLATLFLKAWLTPIGMLITEGLLGVTCVHTFKRH